MKIFVSAMALSAFLGFVGCSKPSAPSTHASKGADLKQGHDHGHDQDHGNHDHSVTGHAHGVGPHGGTVADWGGGKFHVEFLVDHDKQKATVYVLGGDEKTPTPIDTESIEVSIKDPTMQVLLQASPQESDPVGKASRFIGTNEKLSVVQEYSGTITGVVEGTPYSGDFREEAHAGHDHP
jgi:hypothetical protein